MKAKKLLYIVATVALVVLNGVFNCTIAQKTCEYFVQDSAQFISQGETIATKMNREKILTKTEVGQKYCLYQEKVRKCQGIYAVLRTGADHSGDNFGYRIAGGIGYEFHCGFRVEAEFSYFRLQEKMKEEVTEIQEEYSPSVTGNVYYDFTKHRKVNFFVFGGYGQTQTHWHLAAENENVSVKAKNQGGTGTLVYGAGLSFRTSLATSIEIAFRGTHVGSKDRTAEAFGVHVGLKLNRVKKSSWIKRSL